MANLYYNPSGTPSTGSPGASSPMRSEFAAVAAGFALLPSLPATASAAIVVNPGGTALTTTTGTLALAGNFATTGAFNTTLIQGATVSLTLPLASGTLATLAGTESLSNKTLVGATLDSATISGLTGTAAGLNVGYATTAGSAPSQNLTGPITSSGNATSIASQTGTGSTFAMAQSPSLNSLTVTTSFTATGLVSAADLFGTTGSGNVVLATSPTLVTPALGTPASGTLTNCTGYPLPTAASSPNALRNSGLTDWFSGTSGTVPTTAGVTSWTAEGVFAVAAGATLPWAQQATDVANPLSFYSVKFTGAASNTDLKVRFVVESYGAARLAGQTVTFQIPVYNNTGGALVATLATKYPTAQDNWTSSTTDLSATNLQSIANGATGTLAYTLAVSASAINGYEFVVDFGALSANTMTIEIGGGFDARPTPGVSTGRNASPPAPFIQDASGETIWNQRFYQASYENGTAGGAASHLGMVGVPNAGNAQAISLFGKMRAVPTISLWDGGGNSGKFSTMGSAGTFSDNVGTAAAQSGLASTSGFGYLATGGEGNLNLIHYTADARIAGG